MRAVRMPVLSAFVFCSGLCALIYQIGWMRELRLVFGASTYASAAVLAIFMGGLGVGSAALGRRADRHPRPLRLYALLELGIAAGAFASPALFTLVRKIYLSTGGASLLGQPLAVAVRLLLSAVVLGFPTFLMGGTLPAMVKEATAATDARRRRVALLYGVNTLGAVCGVLAATFVLLEKLGVRMTIVSAAALNVAVAATAFAAARRPAAKPVAGGAAGRREAAHDRERPHPEVDAALPGSLVSAAAALTGFVFFLMEIVWYRMLTPLLGGTTYTFGLILAVALAGIGAGGLLAFLLGRHIRPSAGLFAATCGLEGLGLALAFGLGDRLAVLAIALRPAEANFAALAAGWTLVCAVVVFPAALVAGYQFPLLIGLLGRGGHEVGRHTGQIYAWNTMGSILGSLVGGFGLLPLLSAPGCWRLTGFLLCAMCVAALGVSLRRGEGRARLAVPAVFSTIAAALLTAAGPTAAWRHSHIGIGDVALAERSANSVRSWLNGRRSMISWEKDGLESSVALNRVDGLAFVLNGKVDGNALGDAGTQIMGPLVGAILHPGPRKALVIGLGTGSSAGWLAAIDSVRQVDVAELEPAVLEVARRCTPVNRNVLENPKVRIFSEDGREFVMTSRERYDIIFSEPSNPYRAGIASLYTREFYQAVAARLAPGGIFSQWVQFYSVAPETVRLIAATLASVFADVETWQTSPGDIIFVCSAAPKDYTAPRLAARVATEPFRSALRAGWGVEGLEGFLTGFLSRNDFARTALLASMRHGGLNVDDLAPVEFGFAKGLGRNFISLRGFRGESRQLGTDRPAVRGAPVDWDRVAALRVINGSWQITNWENWHESPLEEVADAYLAAKATTVVEAWKSGSWVPVAPLEKVMLAVSFADVGDDRALALLPEVAESWPASAEAIAARFFFRRGNLERAVEELVRALEGFRVAPWDPHPILKGALRLAKAIATADARFAPRLFDALEPAFCVQNLDQERRVTLIEIAMRADYLRGARALAQFEPNVPWVLRVLQYRSTCYAATRNPLAGRAQRELEAFKKAEPKT